MKPSEKKYKVKSMFDAISRRYDFLNHLLSAGMDFYWRKKALKLTEVNSDSVLLDVACGTGDFSIEAAKFGVENIFAVDISLNMLELFALKKPEIKGKTAQSTAEALPFKNETFTNITVAFGVRNFFDIQKAFKEFQRTLKDDGKLTILEFRLPANALIKNLYLFYFRNILPLIGGLISREKEAYSYLPESVDEFHRKINLKELLEKAAFKKVDYYSFTFGIVQAVIAQK